MRKIEEEALYKKARTIRDAFIALEKDRVAGFAPRTGLHEGLFSFVNDVISATKPKFIRKRKVVRR